MKLKQIASERKMLRRIIPLEKEQTKLDEEYYDLLGEQSKLQKEWEEMFLGECTDSDIDENSRKEIAIRRKISSNRNRATEIDNGICDLVGKCKGEVRKVWGG